MLFCINFFIRFSIDFCLLSQPYDPRFHCYLQYFRGLHHFSRSSESTFKKLKKTTQNPCKIVAKIIQKTMPEKRGEKKRKGGGNGSKRPPGKSAQIPEIDSWDAPRTTQEPPGSPKGALKHSTAGKRSSKDPKK